MEKVANPVAEGSNSITHGHHDNGKQKKKESLTEPISSQELAATATLIKKSLLRVQVQKEKRERAQQALNDLIATPKIIQLFMLNPQACKQIILAYRIDAVQFTEVIAYETISKILPRYYQLLARFCDELLTCHRDPSCRSTLLRNYGTNEYDKDGNLNHISTKEIIYPLIERILALVADTYPDHHYYPGFAVALNKLIFMREDLVASPFKDRTEPAEIEESDLTKNDFFALRTMELMGIYLIDAVDTNAQVIILTIIGGKDHFEKYYKFVTTQLADTTNEELEELDIAYLYCYFLAVMIQNKDQRASDVLKILKKMNQEQSLTLTRFLRHCEQQIDE